MNQRKHILGLNLSEYVFATTVIIFCSILTQTLDLKYKMLVFWTDLKQGFCCMSACLWSISEPNFTSLTPVVSQLSSQSEKLKKIFTQVPCYFTFYKKITYTKLHILKRSVPEHHFCTLKCSTVTPVSQVRMSSMF